ncbi:DUF6323 family protein [Clostridium sp. WILCCON 0269]|uniref:DUF6323 family protein n=1 Tax=Candidatus Clostridium eludens TaxID=3381663 RepID=A0ABW8SM22_9CLOT
MSMPEIFHSLSDFKRLNAVNELLKLNTYLKKQNLTLTLEDMKDILNTRNFTLKAHGRIELDINLTKDIIKELGNSPYVNQHNLVESINDIYEIFHYIKNCTSDFLGDEEIFKAVMFFYNKVYNGSIELLKGKGIEKIISNFKNNKYLTNINDEEDNEF